MVCGAGKNIWTPPRNSGRIPSTRFSVIYIENEKADKRRYSQTCLAKPNSQARTGARKFSPVQLTINRIGNLTQTDHGQDWHPYPSRRICDLLTSLGHHPTEGGCAGGD